MSTRSTTHFTHPDWQDGPIAIVYRHSDGYPEGAGADLFRFFDQVKAECEGSMYGTRFNDASYLAAKYVVWLANRFAPYQLQRDPKTFEYVGEADLLNFGSVGILDKDPGDIEYRYVVDCSTNDGFSDDKAPRVTCYKVGFGDTPDAVVHDFNDIVTATLAQA